MTRGTLAAPGTSRTADDGLRLESFLPYRLNVAAETVSLALSRLYAERYGIGIPEWRVIATLGQYDTMTAKDVGLHSQMHKTKVSRAVASLLRKGFVEKRANPLDKRAAFLSLTAKGETTYAALVPLARAFSERLAAELDGTDIAALEAALQRLGEAAARVAEEIAGEDRPTSGDGKREARP
ncbi:DNA-binding MarR family transcriptional regulator [Rhodobium orientis]|uniref:HTH marR-type domain-containing protein n=1 Tax=Rhodobium orientis TaxID=34017 RepID=A0A327JSU1_9HYPH|nr:MarR family winged helix-turn-helix transcriptional regulator [Rhodobium orientis]MBB4304031.1 DNA-binding MarR family transcriptional regulator [Rhodobium orientis]MBK5950760.1 hypothetical protein [Rhodobium orientis]RAI29569.1 hypothetical protein CH339_02670 [Rhodobium orientis]